MADQHRARAEQEVDIFLAVLVPHTAGAALADHHLARKIAKGAAGQNPLRLLHEPVPDAVFVDPIHANAPLPPKQKAQAAYRLRLC